MQPHIGRLSRKAKMPVYTAVRRAQVILVVCSFLLLSLPSAASARSDDAPTLPDLLRQNAYTLAEDNGKFSGPGLGFLVKAARDAQFFGIGEEHNVKEIPEVAAKLFAALHDAHGFNYLVLEQDALACRWASASPTRGSSDRIVALAKQYPNAFTFNSDQELAMIAAAGARSNGKAEVIWGLDQAFGALHILERLTELAPSPEVRERTQKLAEASRTYDKTRFRPGRHYMSDVEKPDDFWRLEDLYRPARDPEAELLATQLVLSARVYQNHKRGTQHKVPGAYESNREREENMKDLFLRRYREAQAQGDAVPKAVLKFGHWHMYRGRYRAYTSTLGNFVGEFARSNGMKSFYVAVHVNNPPGGFRAMRKESYLQALADAAPQDKWTIIDVRPLRGYWYAGLIKLSDELREEIFGFDAILVLGGARGATYHLTAK
jgi:hypothetical protein